MCTLPARFSGPPERQATSGGLRDNDSTLAAGNESSGPQTLMPNRGLPDAADSPGPKILLPLY
jgi:hypothetical protein